MCLEVMSSGQAPFTQLSIMLDSAAELMMVNQNFQDVFDTCHESLRSLKSMEPSEDHRFGELKAGFCILGIQALAEMNLWHGVLSWVLQQYESQENIPAKIMQMCILLYYKVGDSEVMQEAARIWLHCPSNRGAPGFATVAELYLLHVLIPHGHSEEARELIVGDICSGAFTEQQRQMALDVLEETERHSLESPLNDGSESSIFPVSSQGAVIHKLKSMLRFLNRQFYISSSGALRKLFLAAVLLYMLFVRLDPALPSSFLWISKLLQILKQMWQAMFAPYYQAVPQSRKL
ncbi:peroxisome assembly protein 26 [Pholidichthys leucotaenia]